MVDLLWCSTVALQLNLHSGTNMHGHTVGRVLFEYQHFNFSYCPLCCPLLAFSHRFYELIIIIFIWLLVAWWFCFVQDYENCIQKTTNKITAKWQIIGVCLWYRYFSYQLLNFINYNMVGKPQERRTRDRGERVRGSRTETVESDPERGEGVRSGSQQSKGSSMLQKRVGQIF